MQSHEDLEVWRKSIRLCTTIYTVTETFPAKERYGLTSQVRRAVVSIASNIAEGRRRATDPDFRHFLHMAYGSLAEVETQILIGRGLRFCNVTDYEIVRAQTAEISKMLHGMIKKLEAGSQS